MEARGARRAVLIAVLIAVLAHAAALPLGAQSRCEPAVRELAGQSPRQRLREITQHTARHADVIGDGACGWPGTPVLQRRMLRVESESAHVTLQFPVLRTSVLGGVADPRGDGTMWSGRGSSYAASAAVGAATRRIRLLVAPEIWWSENRDYQVIVGRDPARSDFANPFYVGGPWSLDWPMRFGASPMAVVELGNSSAWGTWRSVDAGVSASQQAWGPGLRAHLMLGPDAPGIPRVFVRTAHPVRTRLGTISATGFLGALAESRFFDSNPGNDRRALWAWTAALDPGGSETVSIGVTNGIMLRDGPVSGPASELTTVFIRARSPDNGLRAWAEIGRQDGPSSLRQFLTVPYAGLAYVVGAEYTQPLRGGAILLSGEAVNLEQPVDIRESQPRDFYTSERVPHGWTQKGRLLGVPTGPGSQSQWLSIDWIAHRWSGGIFGERVRWNEDAFLREYLPYQNRHDVTLRAGVRCALLLGPYEATLQLSTGKRLNYLFQNGSFFEGFRTIDVSVPQLRLALTPYTP